MKTLEECRKNIDSIDTQIAALFEQRMHEVIDVAEYKRANGLPILDASREQAVCDKHAAEVQDPAIRGYYVQLQKNIMDLSKQYQRTMLQGMKVAYSGVEGAFAHIACRRIFPDAQAIPYKNFQEAYDSVLKGECDCVVLPIENSYAGEVTQVVDLMFDGELTVNGVYTLRIMQNLLGIPGTRVGQIKKVVSHVQALTQCGPYIEEHGFETEEAVNTARAALAVAETNDPTVAAIASTETANLYGLEVIERNINKSLFNSTRFAVFSRGQNPDRSKAAGTFMMLFSVNHTAGALANAISVISNHGFNMQALRSHPLKDKPWQYYFYVEAEGDETSAEGQAMLAELSDHCSQIRIVGHYAADVQLEED